MFTAITAKRFRVSLVLALVTAVSVWAFEFRIFKRPALSASAVAAVGELPAPVFGLANTSFACAATRGFVTDIQINGGTATAVCSTGFTEATTRCPSSFPMLGYGEQIKCATGEAIRCPGGPVQALGLFKGDSACGDASDRDMGPPGDTVRAAE